MSRRGDIAIAILERFQALDGFTTATRWRDTSAEPFAVEEVPAINFRDSTGTVNHNVSDDEHQLDVMVDIITAPGVTAEAVEEKVNAVIAAIASDDTWGGLADGTNIESHDIDLSAEMGDTISAGQVRLTVHYTTEKGQI